jgi:chaperonin GroES
MEEWEDNLDAALTALPILGCVFKKTYFCGTRKRNVSEYRSPEYIVINYYAKSVDDAPRITDMIELYPNEIRERQLAGIFLEQDIGQSTKRLQEEGGATDDEDQSHVFLEQHCWLDLDDDGLKEPYIATVHYDTKKLVRLVARYKGDGIEYDDEGRVLRFRPERYFTQYPFMKSPDGGIYCMGFGLLLSPMNETVNTTINQLLDSGTIATSQTGFIGRGLALGKGRGGGNLEFTMGEWKAVQYSGDDLRKNIFPLPVREPSGVLFNLLGFMIEAGEKVSSVSEVLTGDQSIHNEPATTTLARIEQGLKVFSAIYKRVYRGMKSEFKKLFRLNQLYLNPETYYTVLDDEKVVNANDYDPKDIDIVPVSDPAEVSDTQKLLKSEILMGMMNMPGLDNQKIIQRRLEALGVPEVDELFTKEPPPPDPKVVLEEKKMELETAKFQFEVQKWRIQSAEAQSKIIRNLADAEAKEIGPQIEQYKAQMQVLLDKEKLDNDRQARVSGMGAKPGNQGN